MSRTSNQHFQNLLQSETRVWLQSDGLGPWTTVYDSIRNESLNSGVFSAFVPTSSSSIALQRSSWDVHTGYGSPGFSQAWDHKSEINTYHRFGGMEPFEPLIIIQYFGGVKEKTFLVSEEFRLFHNLWEDRNSGNFHRILEDGLSELVIEVKGDLIQIRTPYLRQFQAVKQFVLIQYIDQVVFDNEISVSEIDDTNDREEEIGDNWRWVFNTGEVNGRVFSRLLGKRLTLPPPMEQCGIWPFDERIEETYPEFIISEDRNGQLIKYSCDHNKLANYFGANSNAPHFLTPVFFRKEVLRRYYDNPLYAVVDGYIRCAGMWTLPIDNDLANEVAVFLGDLGQSLPETERSYWVAFNISPIGTISSTNYRRSFLAEFVDPKAPDLLFREVYRGFKTEWETKHGWRIFRDLHQDDSHILSGLRIPLNESPIEFENQILALAKLMIDLLNESELNTQLGSKVDNEKGIAKLERYLTTNGYRNVARDIAVLKRIQNLRSKVSAHTKGGGYTNFINKELDGKTTKELVAELFEKSGIFLKGLLNEDSWIVEN